MDHLLDFALGAGLVLVVGTLAFSAYAYRTRLAYQRRKFKTLKRLYEATREQVREMSKRIVDLESHDTRRDRELANLKRVAGNRLYRESLEDKNVQVVQAALQIKQAQDALQVAGNILDVGKVSQQ